MLPRLTRDTRRDFLAFQRMRDFDCAPTAFGRIKTTPFDRTQPAAAPKERDVRSDVTTDVLRYFAGRECAIVRERPERAKRIQRAPGTLG